ncbi:hypothetical protein P3S67_002281 [Capsicum chacoense]
MTKLFFFLIALFVISTVDDHFSWSSKMQAMAKRDLALHLAAVEQQLLPVENDLGTCGRSCTSNADCSDCWLCCECVHTYDPISDSYIDQCDKSLFTGEGYFGTILKNQRLKNIN